MQITVMVALCGADFRVHTMMCLSSTGLVSEIIRCSQQVNKLKYAQTQLIDGEHTFGYLIVHQGINIQQCESC